MTYAASLLTMSPVGDTFSASKDIDVLVIIGTSEGLGSPYELGHKRGGKVSLCEGEGRPPISYFLYIPYKATGLPNRHLSFGISDTQPSPKL